MAGKRITKQETAQLELDIKSRTYDVPALMKKYGKSQSQINRYHQKFNVALPDTKIKRIKKKREKVEKLEQELDEAELSLSNEVASAYIMESSTLIMIQQRKVATARKIPDVEKTRTKLMVDLHRELHEVYKTTNFSVGFEGGSNADITEVFEELVGELNLNHEQNEAFGKFVKRKAEGDEPAI